MARRPGVVLFSLGIVLLIAGLLAYYGVSPPLVGVGWIAWALLVWVGLLILTPFFLAVGVYYMFLHPRLSRFFGWQPTGDAPRAHILEWPKGVKAWSIELIATGFVMGWFIGAVDPTSGVIVGAVLVGAGVIVGLFGIFRWVLRKGRTKFAVEVLPKIPKEL